MCCNSFILGNQGVFAKAEMNNKQGEYSLKRGSFQRVKCEAFMNSDEYEYFVNKV